MGLKRRRTALLTVNRASHSLAGARARFDPLFPFFPELPTQCVSFSRSARAKTQPSAAAGSVLERHSSDDSNPSLLFSPFCLAQ